MVGEYADPRQALAAFLFTSRLSETFTVRGRAASFIVGFFHLHHRALDPGGRRFGLRFSFWLRFGRGVFNQLEQVDQLIIG